MRWLRNLFRKSDSQNEPEPPQPLMVRVDLGVIRIAPKGSAWLATPVQLPTHFDAKVIQTCKDGVWYSFDESGIGSPC